MSLIVTFSYMHVIHLTIFTLPAPYYYQIISSDETSLHIKITFLILQQLFKKNFQVWLSIGKWTFSSYPTNLPIIKYTYLFPLVVHRKHMTWSGTFLTES
jgi:hypothetical protein